MKMHFTELNGIEIENVMFLVRLEDVRLDPLLFEEWRAWVYVQDESLYNHLNSLDLPKLLSFLGKPVSYRRQSTYDVAAGKYFALPAHVYDNYLVDMAVYFWESVVQAGSIHEAVKVKNPIWTNYPTSRKLAAQSGHLPQFMEITSQS